MIRQATKKDLDQITQLHLQTLGNTPNSQIGGWLIRKLYNSAIISKFAKVYVYQEKMQIIGIISLALDLPKVVDEISRSFTTSELAKIAYNMLIHPWTIIAQIKHRLFMRSSSKYLSKSYAGIMTIAVDGSYRSKNIGSKLILHIDNLITTKPRCIYVDTYTTNTRAIKFYIKNGYSNIANSFGNTLLKKNL